MQDEHIPRYTLVNEHRHTFGNLASSPGTSRLQFHRQILKVGRTGNETVMWGACKWENVMHSPKTRVASWGVPRIAVPFERHQYSWLFARNCSSGEGLYANALYFVSESQRNLCRAVCVSPPLLNTVSWKPVAYPRNTRRSKGTAIRSKLLHIRLTYSVCLFRLEFNANAPRADNK